MAPTVLEVLLPPVWPALMAMHTVCTQVQAPHQPTAPRPAWPVHTSPAVFARPVGAEPTALEEWLPPASAAPTPTRTARTPVQAPQRPVAQCPARLALFRPATFALSVGLGLTATEGLLPRVPPAPMAMHTVCTQVQAPQLPTAPCHASPAHT